MKYLRKVAEIFGYINMVLWAVLGLGLWLSSQENEAKRLGFADASDQKLAMTAGITDPEAWKQKKVEQAAAAEEAQRKAKEEADRKAAAEKAERDQRAAVEKAEADRKRAEAERAERAQREAAQAAERKKVEECRKDLSCWAEKGTIAASVYCKREVEKLAKYDIKWTDGFLETKFSHYRWARSDPGNKGIVTYLGDKVRFQNGFGAYQNMVYTCDMVPGDDEHRIYNVSAFPGNLN